MLAKCAKEQWHKDPNEEIFIDRNGFRFQYVLDYLRDGKVYLPPTVARASLISDLQYYGVEPIMENKIDDDLVRGAAYGKASSDENEVAHQWRLRAKGYEKQASILRDCMLIYSQFREGYFYVDDGYGDALYVDVDSNSSWRGSSPEECNKFLPQVRLVVEEIEGDRVYFITL
jgi:hypothetical protein